MNEYDLLHQHAAHARAEAVAMFQFTLAHWARDVLTLRAAGLDRPSWRPGELDHADPALTAHPLRGVG